MQVPTEFETHSAPSASLARFASLTFPSYQPFLRCVMGRDYLAVTAHGEGPMGLALCQVTKRGTSARLLSLFVSRANRRCGLGTSLVDRLIDALNQRGITRLEIGFSTRPDWAKGFQQFLESTGWTDIQDDTIVGIGTVKSYKHVAWLERIPALPSQFQRIRFADLSPKVRQAMLDRVTAGGIPDELRPFEQEQDQVAELSTVLLDTHRRDAVAGWLVVHRIPAMPGVLRYGHLFSEPCYRMRGLSMRLWFTILKQHAASEWSDRYPQFLVDIWLKFGDHLRMFHRRYAEFMDEVYCFRSAVRRW